MTSPSTLLKLPISGIKKDPKNRWKPGYILSVYFLYVFAGFSVIDLKIHVGGS